MQRFVIAITLILAASLTGAAPADADQRAAKGTDNDGIVWLLPTFYAGVQIVTSYPTAADPYLHARFKRVSGEGQRQVRMGERVKKPGTHQWGPYHYTKPVKVAVGEKVVFTSEHVLPCEPEIEPIGIVADMRVKLPGQPWSRWETWIADDQRLLDCEEVLPN